MAFTRATGKHRRPRSPRRSSANAAGIAGLAAGVVGTLASPALASTAEQAPVHTGFSRAADLRDSLATTVSDQAQAQETAAAQAAAEAAARKQAAEAKQKADEAKRKAAAEKAEREHEARKAEQRAARAAEREALGRYVAPVAGSYVSTGYQASSGLWSSGSHTGIDFHAAMGTQVRAVAAGEVVKVGNGGAYGNEIVIKHHDGTYTQYGHLSSFQVSVGQKVTAGQHIALSGNTGNTTGPHLHFEARTGPDYGSDMDPIAYLRKHGVDV